MLSQDRRVWQDEILAMFVCILGPPEISYGEEIWKWIEDFMCDFGNLVMGLWV